MYAALIAILPLAAGAAAAAPAVPSASTCSTLKKAYKELSGCCDHPDGELANHTSNYQTIPMPPTRLAGTNVCAGKKPVDAFEAGDGYFNNVQCTLADGVANALEQAGTNVTLGYVGDMDVGDRQPITTSYLEAGLCPVNVHWHLGAEHYSAGQYDEHGVGPDAHSDARRLAEDVRLGWRCHHYDHHSPKFTIEYDWQYCVGMHVGETYEVHWPHSAAGACGTPNQYQSPFYDGVFCRDGVITLNPLNTYTKIGVQSQTFTIVNDEHYFYPDLMRGMIVDGEYGRDVTKYTGSTTGTSRDSETVCSRYTPITWQVDRNCHLISASAFDKMCADMKAQRDDMSGDLHPHGSRETVADFLAADNHQ
mmetsp:Transcript_115911/g.328485  ORF Transcript_115911/g.328485 Transcript_115911/m.328485 type:complete len:364 (-) Transcript_115911:203-1294(-)